MLDLDPNPERMNATHPPIFASQPAVTRALLPCGGKGTRMLALTRGQPKEMLEVAGMPLVERVARECAASGIEELLVVIAPGKEVIQDHFHRLREVSGLPRHVDFVVQQDARGLADAIRLGRNFSSGAPLAVALPDNLFVGPRPALAQVIDEFGLSGTSVVAVVEIREIDAERRGPTPVLPGRLDGRTFQIERVPAKGSKEGRFDTGGAPSAFTAVGRYVFQPAALEAIDEVEASLPPGAELDDVPLMQLLVERRQLVGRHIEGRFLDVGLPSGLTEAEALLTGSAG